MNIFLWILQILLAFYHIAGAIYMMGHYQILGNSWAVNAFPKSVWIILGVLEVLFGVGLVVPPLMKKNKNLVSVSAYGLAVISLLGIVLFVAYSGFPGMLWAILPAAVVAFVGYKRKVKS